MKYLENVYMKNVYRNIYMKYEILFNMKIFRKCSISFIAEIQF